MAVALDADAIIAFLDRSDALHDSAAKLITAHASSRGRLRGPLVVSVVTYAEVLTGALRGHRDERLIRGFFADLVAAVIPVDREVAETAARLRAKNTLRMPDALVLATAELQSDVTALLTGDVQLANAKGTAVRISLLTHRDS